MIVREARCSCGRLSARAEGEPFRISVCHCLECKRRSGSALSWNAHYPAERIAVEGSALSYARSSEEGFWARFHFCGKCGVTVWYEIERRPGVVSIPAGVFADPGFPPPAVEVYEERRCPWLGRLAPASG